MPASDKGGVILQLYKFEISLPLALTDGSSVEVLEFSFISFEQIE